MVGQGHTVSVLVAESESTREASLGFLCCKPSSLLYSGYLTQWTVLQATLALTYGM